MQSICWAAMAARRGLEATYDRIGIGYGKVRRPDPRLAVMIAEALGDAETIVNVGAGAGSYESSGRRVVAARSRSRSTSSMAISLLSGDDPRLTSILASGAQALPSPIFRKPSSNGQWTGCGPISDRVPGVTGTENCSTPTGWTTATVCSLPADWSAGSAPLLCSG